MHFRNTNRTNDSSNVSELMRFPSQKQTEPEETTSIIASSQVGTENKAEKRNPTLKSVHRMQEGDFVSGRLSAEKVGRVRTEGERSALTRNSKPIGGKCEGERNEKKDKSHRVVLPQSKEEFFDTPLLQAALSQPRTTISTPSSIYVPPSKRNLLPYYFGSIPGVRDYHKIQLRREKEKEEIFQYLCANFSKEELCRYWERMMDDNSSPLSALPPISPPSVISSSYCSSMESSREGSSRVSSSVASHGTKKHTRNQKGTSLSSLSSLSHQMSPTNDQSSHLGLCYQHPSSLPLSTSSKQKLPCSSKSCVWKSTH